MRGHHAARCRRGEARLSRRQRADRPAALPRRARQVPHRRTRAADRRLHAGGAAVCRDCRRRRRCHLRQHPRDRWLVEGRRQRRPENGGADRGRRRARAGLSVRELFERGRGADLRPRRARHRSGEPAEGSPRRHRPDQAARRGRAAAHHRFSGGEGRDPLRQGLSRRVRDRGRRLRGAGAVLARHARVRACQERRGLALRSDARSLGRHAAVHRERPARRLPARRSGRRRRRDARGAEGARSDRHLRQAALYRFRRRHLRAFALQDRRLQPLPRPLPDRRDHARRQSCGDRRAYLRGMRTMRGGLPDRRRLLCAAACRHADAAAARAAHRLPRSRRQGRGRADPRRRARRAADRRAGALRRRAARECAAGRRQRGDAGRPRNDRGGVRLWRIGRAAAAAGEAAPRRCGPGQDAGAGRTDPRGPRLRRGPRRHHRNRRPGRARRRRCARSRRRRPRPIPRASTRSAASAT